MSWKEKIISSPTKLPPRIVLLGPPGIGKTTFGASLPKPILADFDKGSDEVNVDRLPATTTWEDSLALIRDIANDPMDYKSLVIDTLDPLEDQAEVVVCREGGNKKSISDFGYGAGYEALASHWRVMLAEIDQVRAKGLVICLLAHTTIRSAQDPTLGEYDEYTSQLQKKTWSATLRWADVVGFANFNSARVEKEKRAIVDSNTRLLYTVRGSGYTAKNRYNLPQQMPFSWASLEAGIKGHQVTVADVILRIESLAKGTPFEEKAKGFVLEAKLDMGSLLQIEEALKTKLNGAQASA